MNYLILQSSATQTLEALHNSESVLYYSHIEIQGIYKKKAVHFTRQPSL